MYQVNKVKRFLLKISASIIFLNLLPEFPQKSFIFTAILDYTIRSINLLFSLSLPPQGFRPEAKPRGGTLVTRAYIKDSTYSSNIQSVY